MTRVLVFGAGGMLGREFADGLRPGRDVLGLTHADCDVTDAGRVTDAVRDASPQIVVNAAALIDVAACERDPARAHAVNADGARHVADAVRTHAPGGILLQPSTCYVFGNAKERYAVDDAPDPVNAYGASKAAGERAVADVLTGSKVRYHILRTSWLYSVHRKTFVDVVAERVLAGTPVDVVADQANTVTWTRDYVAACVRIAEEGRPSGIVHVQNATPAPLSKLAIARTCCRLLGRDGALAVPAASARVSDVPRPRSAFLDTDAGAPRLRAWDDALAAYLHEVYGT